jgi:outer membrane protein TolC
VLLLAVAVAAGAAPGADAQVLRLPGAEGQALRLPSAGSVPTGEVQPGVIQLPLSEAIDRALRANLSALMSEYNVESARAARYQSLAGILPSLNGALAAERQKISLEAFGFTGPGIPRTVGPFNVFDARLHLSQPVFDLSAIQRAIARTRGVDAARLSAQDVRQVVVLVTTGLYLQATASRSRIASAEAQLATAEVLARQAQDLKASGMVAGIDVLRALVQADAARQRLIVARNDYARQKLDLARAIGLPLGQTFEPSDRLEFAPLEALDPDAAVREALATRADFKAALSRLEAAEADRRAASFERIPALDFAGSYGNIGQHVDSTLPTYALGGVVRIPLFEGGRIKARELEADAALKRQQAVVGDLRGQIDYEVRTALLDASAAEERVGVARRALDLANQQLTQARDRFAAGVASNIEVVQAQESVAGADDSYLASLFAHGVARAQLARAMGAGAPAAAGTTGASK